MTEGKKGKRKKKKKRRRKKKKKKKKKGEKKKIERKTLIIKVKETESKTGRHNETPIIKLSGLHLQYARVGSWRHSQ